MSLVSGTAVVVGGGRGIGRAVCHELARRGAQIALIYRRDHGAANDIIDLVRGEGRKAAAFPGDITDADVVSQLFEKIVAEFGTFGILVQVAGGVSAWKRIAEITPAQWREFLSVELIGSFNVFRAALPVMRGRESSIIAISSIAAAMCPARNAQSAAAKAGLEALVRVLAREEGRNGIRANAVAIGLTESEATDQAIAHWGAETAQRVIARIPLGRIGTPKDVAQMVAFLASVEASYVTGKVLTVDGGQFIGA